MATKKTKVPAKKTATKKIAAKKENIVVYHNTRCSKSREACSILEEEGVTFQTIEYLHTPPTPAKIKELLKMLGIKAEELVRKSEPLFKEKFEGKKLTEAQWIKTMADNPILIERPIIVKGKTAIIGRPPEKVLELI